LIAQRLSSEVVQRRSLHRLQPEQLLIFPRTSYFPRGRCEANASQLIDPLGVSGVGQKGGCGHAANLLVAIATLECRGHEITLATVRPGVFSGLRLEIGCQNYIHNQSECCQP
jgi:hypothetical protein